MYQWSGKLCSYLFISCLAVGFWNSMLESVCNSWLKTREGRAGMVHNFMRGLSLNHVYPYSPFDVSVSQG